MERLNTGRRRLRQAALFTMVPTLNTSTSPTPITRMQTTIVGSEMLSTPGTVSLWPECRLRQTLFNSYNCSGSLDVTGKKCNLLFSPVSLSLYPLEQQFWRFIKGLIMGGSRESVEETWICPSWSLGGEKNKIERKKEMCQITIKPKPI
jgi:hypothetical protein